MRDDESDTKGAEIRPLLLFSFVMWPLQSLFAFSVFSLFCLRFCLHFYVHVGPWLLQRALSIQSARALYAILAVGQA
jgi:hypothetical protein